MPSEHALDAFRRGDNQQAARLAHADLERAVADADAAARVDALCMLARVALREGDLDVVRLRAEEARGVAAGADDARLERMPVHLLAVAARMSGALEQGRALYLHSIGLNEGLGEARMAALEHRNLAYLEIRAGDSDRARYLIAEARRRLMDLDAAALKPYLTFDEATVAALDADLETAAAKLAEADEQFRAAGTVPDPDDAAEMSRLRGALGL